MNDLTIIHNFNQNVRMSSRDIAELTDKQHKNVMRDIENLIDKKAINGLNFELVDYTDAKGENRPMYMLDFHATMTLVTGYDAKRRALVIDRWIKLETGEAQPALVKADASLTTKHIPEHTRAYKALFSVGKLIGLNDNQAAISADQGLRKVSGHSMLALINSTHLVSESQEIHLTPSDIGVKLGLSGQAVNKLLESEGLQTSYRDHKNRIHWNPIDDGKSLAVLKDTGKVHSDGTPITQVFWRESVMERLNSHDAVA